MPSRAKLEKHFEADHFPRCISCDDEVRPGHIVFSIEDAGEVHVDCNRPYRLTSDPNAFAMLGEPMMRITLRQGAVK